MRKIGLPRGPGSNDLPSIARFQQQVADAIYAIIDDSHVFEGTLRTSQTTSTFAHPEIGIGSAVLFIPTTANAAAVVASMYQSTTANGQVVFTHPSNANADKTFRFVIFGGAKPRAVTPS